MSTVAVLVDVMADAFSINEVVAYLKSRGA